jgi:hypothetical protein
MLKNLAEYESNKPYFVGKIHGHSSPVSPTSLPGVSAGYCQIALVDESEIITTQMGNAQ